MSNKIKHLEFIQAIIKRMAGNSFLLKGWSVTLISALFVASFNNLGYLFIIYPVALFFWIFDSYFLWQERLFRALYDDVRLKNEEQINFSMNIKQYNTGRNTWKSSIFSVTFLISYFLLFIVVSILLIINS